MQKVGICNTHIIKAIKVLIKYILFIKAQICIKDTKLQRDSELNAYLDGVRPVTI